MRASIFVLAAAATVWTGGAAVAAGAVDGELTSFSGSCSASGTVAFEPAATDNPQSLTYAYTATGTCNGTLNGSRVSNAPVTLEQGGSSNGSCTDAHTTSPGQGSINFAHTRILRYNLTFQSVTTEVAFSFSGDDAGRAVARGPFLTDRTSPALTAECAGGGASRVPMDITVVTQSTMVSSRPDQ